MTGKSLYEDVKLQEFIHEGLHVNYCHIESGKEWDDLMDTILKSCIKDGIIPILHLEIHGWEGGIQFSNRDQRTIDQVGEQFRAINIATACNLFITLGVCKGLYVLFNAHLDRPMPFCGAIGSFNKLMSGDIELRFAEFYGTFFRTFDIAKAYIELMKAAPITEYSQYRYVRVDEIFYKAYLDYINKACKSDNMKQRALNAAEENGVDLINRQARRKFEKDFKKQEKKTRDLYYNEAVRTFYMLEKYPENKDRFEIPNTYRELEERCKKIISI